MAVQINYGDFNGVKVHDTPDHAIVEINKFEAVTAAQFKGKVQGGFYSSFINHPDIKPADGNVLLGVDKNFLRSDSQIRDFNQRVDMAGRIHAKYDKDYTDINTQFRFDHAEEGMNIVTRRGRDTEMVQGENGQQEKAKNWAFGDVLARNDSYVAFSAGQNDSAKFVRVLPIEKFAQDKQQEKLHAEFIGRKIAGLAENEPHPYAESMKVGDFKRITWEKNEGKSGSFIAVEDKMRRELKAVPAPQEPQQPVQQQQEQEQKQSKSRSKKKDQALAA